MLNIREHKKSYFVTIRNTARLNTLIADLLKTHLMEIVNQSNKEVVLSLAGIKFIDSSGFEAIMSVVKMAREKNCTFKICDVSQDVYELIRLMKLNVVFEIHPESVLV